MTNTTESRAHILGPAGVAALLDCSERHLIDVRNEDPTFPRPRMVGKLPRWTDVRILEWVDAASHHDIPTRPAATTPSARKPKGAGRVH